MESLNLVLIGPPGSGKGTQAELLRDKNGFVHYSTGEVFRDHIRRKTPVGARVEEYVTSGRLVPDEVVKRLTARRQCRKCSKIYNLTFKPSKVAGVCDDCGGELYQRKDDSEAVISDRLSTYHTQTEPVLHYYSGQGKLKRIDGALGRDKVYQGILRLIA